MRKSNLWNALFPIFGGAVLALVVVFSASVFTSQVRADEVDYWCPSTPPTGCNHFGCFGRGDGAQKCKFIAYENGATCTSDQNCVRAPGGGEWIEQ